MQACWFVNTHGTNPDLPTGGNRPQVIVLTRHEDLHDDMARACTDSGATLDPAAARALACDCEVVPVTVNGSQPLDVGRSTRIVPPRIRHALRVRDGGCAHPGCDRIPSWTEAHHIIEWSKNGPTSLNCETAVRRSRRCDPSFDWPCGCLEVDLSAGSSDTSEVAARTGSDLIGA